MEKKKKEKKTVVSDYKRITNYIFVGKNRHDQLCTIDRDRTRVDTIDTLTRTFRLAQLIFDFRYVAPFRFYVEYFVTLLRLSNADRLI